MPKFRHLSEWEASADDPTQIGRFRGETVATLRFEIRTMVTVSVKGQRIAGMFRDAANARLAAQHQFEILQNSGHLESSRRTAVAVTRKSEDRRR